MPLQAHPIKTFCEQSSEDFLLLANLAEAQDGKDLGLWMTAPRATTNLIATSVMNCCTEWRFFIRESVMLSLDQAKGCTES